MGFHRFRLLDNIRAVLAVRRIPLLCKACRVAELSGDFCFVTHVSGDGYRLRRKDKSPYRKYTGSEENASEQSVRYCHINRKSDRLRHE